MRHCLLFPTFERSRPGAETPLESNPNQTDSTPYQEAGRANESCSDLYNPHRCMEGLYKCKVLGSCWVKARSRRSSRLRR